MEVRLEVPADHHFDWKLPRLLGHVRLEVLASYKLPAERLEVLEAKSKLPCRMEVLPQPIAIQFDWKYWEYSD